jgi:hypothetical protein
MIELYKSKHTESYVIWDYVEGTKIHAVKQTTAKTLETVLRLRTRNLIMHPKPLVSYYLLHTFKDWDEVKNYYPEYFI